jgi:hypothetical protein
MPYSTTTDRPDDEHRRRGPDPAPAAAHHADRGGDADQRALRRLSPDPVDDSLVLRPIELTLKAPTDRNAQNWEFVPVRDRAVKARLAGLYRMA